MSDVTELFDRVPALAQTPRSVTALPGGLTNRNYKVTTPGGAYVARVWSQGDMLAINRDHEHHNSVAAAQAGVGAPVVAYCPEDNLLVLGYIDGRTFGNADVAEPANIGRIARACRMLHAGPTFLGEFDMFAIQQRYRAVAREHGFAIPAGYDDLMGHVADARKALAVRQAAIVPCNNDACFELGNIWGECKLSLDALAELITAYYGAPLRNKIARARLLGVMGKYGWTLWGAIQHATSPLDFDFWSWAMERFEGAAEGLTSHDFARLLEDVQRED